MREWVVTNGQGLTVFSFNELTLLWPDADAKLLDLDYIII